TGTFYIFSAWYIIRISSRQRSKRLTDLCYNAGTMMLLGEGTNNIPVILAVSANWDDGNPQTQCQESGARQGVAQRRLMHVPFRENHQDAVLFQDGFSRSYGFKVCCALHNFQGAPNSGKYFYDSRCHGHFGITDEFYGVFCDFDRADRV